MAMFASLGIILVAVAVLALAELVDMRMSVTRTMESTKDHVEGKADDKADCHLGQDDRDEPSHDDALGHAHGNELV